MSYLPQSKYGDCSCGCGGKDVQGRKVGKNFYCLNSYSTMKRQQYAAKINLNNKVRAMGNKQVANGNYEDASTQALKNDLDFVFSRIVRMTAADEFGNCAFYTCGAIKHWSLQQCGHFIKRGDTQTRWDFRNARVQDKWCNENLKGNLEVYEKRLEEEYPGLPGQLREIAQEPYKWGRDELKQLLIDLRAKLRIIENRFNPH
jgi:hypothetical protein